jgi:NADH:ubiquinone oxidoreductase subunit 4 (subunit M)
LLLKLGYFGYFRFIIPFFPYAHEFYRSYIIIICVIGCIYGALLALGQLDLKKLIAYSSVSHMSLCLLGILTSNLYGFLGSILLAIGHGFISSALFLLIGILYERYHIRNIEYYSGLNSILPIFSFFLFYFVLSNFGFPISLNFIAELFILVGIGNYNLFILGILIFYSIGSLLYNS